MGDNAGQMLGQLEVATTGVELLDNKLGGGFPRNSTLLFMSEVPAEKRIFAERFIMAGIRNKETCLYVDFYRAPQLARREFRRFGPYDEQQLVFVDATSSQLLLQTSERFVIRDPGNFRHLLDVMKRAIMETRPQRIVFDSAEFLIDRFPLPEVIDFWHVVTTEAKSVGSTICFMLMNWTCDPTGIRQIRDMTDYVVEFRSAYKGGVLNNMVRIEESRNGGLNTNWLPCSFEGLGGVKVIYPRVLVTGPPDAGKSTLMKNLADVSVSIDWMGTSVTFDNNSMDFVTLGGGLLGTPAQERFEFLFKTFMQETNGLFLVIDSSSREDIDKAKKMMELVGLRAPVVIVANKSDLPGAATAQEIRQAIGCGDGVRVVPTVATTGAGVKEALTTLVNRIMGVT